MLRMIRGPMIFRAPENDQGSEPDDLDDDISLDELDEDEADPDEDEVDPDADAGGGDPDDSPQRQSRGENRVAAATRVAAEAKREAAELRARLDASERRAAEATQQPRETQDQINARLAAMEPWERTEYLRQQDAKATQAALQQMRFESQDASDRASYEALCARKPVAAKLRDEVESRLADMRKTGTTAPRETVLRWVIGDRALANEGRATGKARTTAAANRDRQSARPTNGRGNAAGDRRSTGSSARDKRVEDYQL